MKQERLQVTEAAFFSALMAVKQVFPDQTLGVGDSERWSRWEEKATLDLRAACFEYQLAGQGPEELADLLLKFFPEIKSAISTGGLEKQEYQRLTTGLAGYLLNFYPGNVKLRYSGLKR